MTLEQSREESGFRHYLVEPQTYDNLSFAIDQTRGLPAGVGTIAVTKRGVPLRENMPIAPNGFVHITIDNWRLISTDDEMLAAPTAAGLVIEITKEEHDTILEEIEAARTE